MAEAPLLGRRVIVTRPRDQGGALVKRLEQLGAVVTAVPLIAIEPVDDPTRLAAALAKLDRYDWIVFTSANGAEAVRGLGANLNGARVAAVGPVTADAVRRLGVEPSFVPERFAGEEIAAGLEPLGGARILLPQADVADPELAEELSRRGAMVDAIPAYRTVEFEGTPFELAELRTADAVVLASGSAARSLASQGGAGAALVLCIGPKTAEIASDIGLPVGLVAREATTEGIIQALVTHWGDH